MSAKSLPHITQQYSRKKDTLGQLETDPDSLWSLLSPPSVDFRVKLAIDSFAAFLPNPCNKTENKGWPFLSQKYLSVALDLLSVAKEVVPHYSTLNI